jgi:hypothetical protein
MCRSKSGLIGIIANIVLTICIFTTFPCKAQTTPSRALLALSKGDHVLAIIDPVNRENYRTYTRGC